MSSIVIDNGLHWFAVVLYCVASIINTYGIIFLKERFEKRSHTVAIAALLVHGFAIMYRWLAVVGHGPYLARSEILSANAWILLFLFYVFLKFFPKIRQGSIFLFPIAFFLIALSLFLEPPTKIIPVTFHGIWLVLHVIFIKLSLAAFLIALAFSLFFILKNRAAYQWLSRLPDLPTLDVYAYRFAGFGFVFWTNATISGSLWAYQSWGRFWGWDVVESWSFITWILFGLYLHLRKFFRMRGEAAAYFLSFCFVISILTLFFIPLLDTSAHSGYFK